MSVDQLEGSELKRKPRHRYKTCPGAAVSTTNLTWPTLGSKPGCSRENQVTSRLSYGTTFTTCLSWRIKLRCRHLYSLKRQDNCDSAQYRDNEGRRHSLFRKYKLQDISSTPVRSTSWKLVFPSLLLLPSATMSVNKNADDKQLIHSSMVLQLFVGPWLLQFRILFYRDGRAPSTSDQPIARPLPTHRTSGG
jgi:hypothetical protein